MSAATGLAAADETRVVFVTHGQSGDPYWSVVKNGMDDAAKTLGVKAEYLAPETFDMAKMAQMIDAAVASKPDGLVVSIPDAAALGESVKNAVAAGIPVIVIDSGGSKLTKELGGLLCSWASRNIEAGVHGRRAHGQGSASTRRPASTTRSATRASTTAAPASPRGSASTCRCVQGVIDPTEMKTRMLAYLTAHPDVEFMLAVGASGGRAGAGRARRAGACRQGQDRHVRPVAGHPAGDRRRQDGMGHRRPAISDGLHPGGDVRPHGRSTRSRRSPTIRPGPGFVTKDAAASVIDLAKQGKR